MEVSRSEEKSKPESESPKCDDSDSERQGSSDGLYFGHEDSGVCFGGRWRSPASEGLAEEAFLQFVIFISSSTYLAASI